MAATSMSTVPPSPAEPIPIASGDQATENFFSAAIPRMLRFILIFGGIFTLIVVWRFSVVLALGFAAGAVIAYLSFRSLHKAVKSLASRIVASGQTESGFALVNGFFLRYLLAGVVACGIFTSSPRAFRGFLFGLCTPVAAMLMEAGYEVYAALRRGY